MVFFCINYFQNIEIKHKKERNLHYYCNLYKNNYMEKDKKINSSNQKWSAKKVIAGLTLFAAFVGMIIHRTRYYDTEKNLQKSKNSKK